MNNIKYSPLGKVFNKGIQREDKKQDLLKRLKNIDDTTKYQIKIQLKPIENDINNPNEFSNKTILEVTEILNKIKGLGNKIDYTKIFCVNTNGKIFDFHIFQKQGDFT